MEKKCLITKAAFISLVIALCAWPFSVHTSKAENLGNMVESFGDSIGKGLENLGQQLNRANDSFLNAVDGQKNNGSYESQMRQYRQMEAARVNEMADVTGVSPDYIRQLRSDGMTWEQIANKYRVNLDSLPAPQTNVNP